MGDKDLYRKICKEKKGVPLFLQPWWLDLVAINWDAAIVRKGDEIAGIWPYCPEHKLGVPMFRTPMLTPYLGPHIFYPADLKESRKDSFEHETVAALMKEIPEAEVWHLAVQPGLKQVGLFRQHKLQAQVQQTFIVGLNEPEAALLANIKESTRKNIRQAEKELVITNDKTCIKQLFEFQQNTLAGKGKQLPYKEKDLKKMLDACLSHDGGAIWVARNGETIEAIVWQVWDDNNSYYLMGGQNPETTGYKAMSLLLWHCIKESKKRNHFHFDLEGSMDPGVERFFRNFGGQRELYMILLKNDSLLWKLKKGIMG